MELLSHTDPFTLWLIQYGSIALFVMLLLGIIALPIPDETLMVLSGILMSNGNLLVFPTIAAAYAGSICGISLSYVIGKTLGIFFIHKYGRWIGITAEKLEKAHTWFEKYGKWTLLFGYFIPGIRHFTGFSAGTTSLAYAHFAVFAYIGAVIWASVFLSIGYFFGEYWLSFGSYWISLYDEIEINAEWVIIALLGMSLVISLFFLFKKNRSSSP